MYDSYDWQLELNDRWFTRNVCLSGLQCLWYLSDLTVDPRQSPAPNPECGNMAFVHPLQGCELQVPQVVGKAASHAAARWSHKRSRLEPQWGVSARPAIPASATIGNPLPFCPAMEPETSFK